MALYGYGPRRAERQVVHPVLPPAFTCASPSRGKPASTNLPIGRRPDFWFFVAFAACQRIGGPPFVSWGGTANSRSPRF